MPTNFFQQQSRKSFRIYKVTANLAALPKSWRYIQSSFGQVWFFMKCEQYFVVPNDAFIVLP